MEVKFSNTPLNIRQDHNFNLSLKEGLNHKLGKSNFAFLGLTKTAQRHIFIDPKLLEKINGVNNTDIIGEPPGEFILPLKDGEDKNLKIKKIMNSFSLAAAELRKAEEHSFEGHEFEVLEYARLLDEALSNGNSFKAENLFQKLLRMQASNATFAPVLDTAAAHIDEAFKETGILPEDASVHLDFLSEGGRGYAFKVSFLDSEGKKFYHDKILKLYRSSLSNVARHMAETVYDYTNNRPDEYFGICQEKMTEYYSANAQYIPNYYNLSKEALVGIKVDDYMLSVEYFQRKQKKKTKEELFKEYRDFVNEFIASDTYHGVFAEANSSMYIKKRAGKIKETNYIEPWFFNLKSGYCLMEASDDELPPVKKEVDLDKLGLYHSDLEYNPGNIVKGRVIDYGGIQPK